MEAKQLSQLAPVDLDLYNEITLTEDEIKIALFEARQKKSGQLKREAYAKKVAGAPTFISFTSEEVQEMVRKNIPGFIVDDFNEEIIEHLCHYFTGDPRSKYDPKKGLMMYGPVGCGKTTLMNFFRNNQVSSFLLFSARQIAAEYGKFGFDSISRYRTLIPTSDITRTFGQGALGICFDDLGTEVDKKHYGNESNVMAEILLNRYDNQKNLTGKTHVTTNLNTTELEERYGYRVRSRAREMFNVVIFDEKSPDRRK